MHLSFKRTSLMSGKHNCSRVTSFSPREESFFFNDWFMHSLKTHPHSTTNRLSGPVPAHTASVLLLAGPPEAFQRDYFLWHLLRMETLCSRDKLLEPADAVPCALPVSCRQAVDLHFQVKGSQNIAVSKWPLSVWAGWKGWREKQHLSCKSQQPAGLAVWLKLRMCFPLLLHLCGVDTGVVLRYK